MKQKVKAKQWPMCTSRKCLPVKLEWPTKFEMRSSTTLHEVLDETLWAAMQRLAQVDYRVLKAAGRLDRKSGTWKQVTTTERRATLGSLRAKNRSWVASFMH
jgi:hypothetical protein